MFGGLLQQRRVRVGGKVLLGANLVTNVGLRRASTARLGVGRAAIVVVAAAVGAALGIDGASGVGVGLDGASGVGVGLGLRLLDGLLGGHLGGLLARGMLLVANGEITLEAHSFGITFNLSVFKMLQFIQRRDERRKVKWENLIT